SGKTRLEYSQIFVDFEKNKKKRSFKRKMVLGITPNTKFVYSLNRKFLRLFFRAFLHTIWLKIWKKVQLICMKREQ
ncbi:hypothetical protein, partial [Blautia obeum]|uniref:hypothetical protein n=1 Tax=Blautia obeum TaxID=40520 RepID=UPI001D088EB5